MIIVNSVLGIFSLEKGSYIIGWLVLILSVMAFYVNLILITGACFVTPEVLSDYLKDTHFANMSQKGNTECLMRKFCQNFT